MKQRPEYVVAVSVVVLVHDFLIQEHWYTSLLGERSCESSLADLVGDVDARPSDPLRVHVLDAEEGADEAAGADLQGPLVLAAAIGGDGEAVGDDEEALLHPAEAEAAEPAARPGERRPRRVPRRRRAARVVHVGGRGGPRRERRPGPEVRDGGRRGGRLRGVRVHGVRGTGPHRRRRREGVAAAALPAEHAVVRGGGGGGGVGRRGPGATATAAAGEGGGGRCRRRGGRHGARARARSRRPRRRRGRRERDGRELSL